MNTMLFSLDNKPDNIPSFRKASTIQLLFVSEPFEVDSQEGRILIAPDTVDDWEDGYYVAYPDDGSKPYAISPSFIKKNYIRC